MKQIPNEIQPETQLYTRLTVPRYFSRLREEDETTLSNEPTGSVTVFESATIPFTDLRKYYVTFGSSGEKRGGHGHHLTKQVFHTIRGSVIIYMSSDKEETELILLEGETIYMPPGVYHTTTSGEASNSNDITQPTILLVFASTLFDPTDYFYENSYINNE